MRSVEEITAGRSWLEDSPKASVYRLELKSQKHPIDETIRLRRLLKLMLRGFGFRCISIRVERVEKF